MTYHITHSYACDKYIILIYNHMNLYNRDAQLLRMHIAHLLLRKRVQQSLIAYNRPRGSEFGYIFSERDLPRSFHWCFVHSESLDRYRARSRFGVRGGSDYTLL